MRTTTLTCDRCGANIPVPSTTRCITAVNSVGQDVLEFCEMCWESFDQWLAERAGQPVHGSKLYLWEKPVAWGGEPTLAPWVESDIPMPTRERLWHLLQAPQYARFIWNSREWSLNGKGWEP